MNLNLSLWETGLKLHTHITHCLPRYEMWLKRLSIDIQINALLNTQTQMYFYPLICTSCLCHSFVHSVHTLFDCLKVLGHLPLSWTAKITSPCAQVRKAICPVPFMSSLKRRRIAEAEGTMPWWLQTIFLFFGPNRGQEVEWSLSFYPTSADLCLNLSQHLLANTHKRHIKCQPKPIESKWSQCVLNLYSCDNRLRWQWRWGQRRKMESN